MVQVWFFGLTFPSRAGEDRVTIMTLSSIIEQMKMPHIQVLVAGDGSSGWRNNLDLVYQRGRIRRLYRKATGRSSVRHRKQFLCESFDMHHGRSGVAPGLTPERGASHGSFGSMIQQKLVSRIHTPIS